MLDQEKADHAIMTTEILLPEKRLSLADLQFLRKLGTIKDGRVLLERSTSGFRLKTPISFDLDRILALDSKALAEYIVNSFITQRPSLIPWVLQHKTLIELANHLLRACSGSKMGLYGYTNTVSLYCRRLNTDPDSLIADAKPEEIPTPARIEKHRGFLQQCINELQDLKRSPGRIHGYAKQIRTFYRVNGVVIPKPRYVPKPKVVSKDRAPTPEELQRLIEAGDLREKVIVTLIAKGGFREGTLSILTYGHVKKDLEAGVIPVHVHVDMDETKGLYSDYDTFEDAEAVGYLKLYLEQRRNGSSRRSDQKYLPPEDINDSSPLVRDAMSKTPRGIGPKQIYKQIHDLLRKTGLDKKNKHGGYELRVHSIRKFFKTRAVGSGMPESHADFMMGHVTDTYNQVQSLGIEKLRAVYKSADLSIRTDSRNGKVDLLKQMLRSLGATSDEMAEAFRSFTEPNKIYTDPELQAQEEMQGFMTVFVNKISDRLKNQQPSILKSPGPD